MTAGQPLSDFSDFVEATGSAQVSAPNDLRNEAQKHTYFIGKFLGGDHNIKKTLQGGSSIRENAFFQDNGTFEFYQPGANHEWQNPQRLQRIEAYWRFALTHMSWTEQEILLNESITSGNADARFFQFTSIRNEREALMWTTKWNGMETNLWTTPVAATMEGEGAGLTAPYSIPAFINEDTTGLFGDGWYTGNEWTVVEGLTPGAAALDSKWQPQQITYSSESVNDNDNIVSNFDEMWLSVKFEAPAMHQQYFEDPRLNQQVIATSKVGRAAIQQLLRAGQDHFVFGNQDPAYPHPTYYGIPIVYVSELDTALLYDGGSNLPLAEDTADIKGPRFYWMNGNYLYPVMHSQRYFHKHEVTKSHNVIDTWVCPVATWYNVFCTSRQRQGIVYPSADLYY